jgi:integrase/recombinase XerD
MRRWDGLVDGYIKECETRGLSNTTMMTRRSALDRCGAWLKQRRPRVNLETVSSEQLVAYLKTRSAFRSKSTVAGCVSDLRCFGEYLVSQAIWSLNPMRWIKGPKMDPRMHIPRRLGHAQMSRIWEEADKRKPDSARRLLVCLLALLYGTGLRRGELSRLDLTAWDRAEGVLKIDGRKTGCERIAPVGAGVWRCLEAYLPVRQAQLERAQRLDEVALLINRRGWRLSGDAISRLVGQCAKRAGIPFVSLHQFRHACASDLLESGVRMPEVKAILGHAAIATTMRYVQVSGTARAEAMAKHPINELLAEVAGPAERSLAV